MVLSLCCFIILVVVSVNIDDNGGGRYFVESSILVCVVNIRVVSDEVGCDRRNPVDSPPLLIVLI
jgi:hypothetical protein